MASKKFFPGRGCTTAVTDGEEGDSTGHYDVDGLKDVVSAGKEFLLISNVSPTEADITSKVATLGGKRILYTFGKAMGDIQINGELLMGEVTAGPSGSMAKLKQWFDTRRVSELENTVQVTAGSGNSYNVALTSLSFAHPDPEFNSVQFLITGVIIPDRDTRS